ncbi:hypothetical protein I4641_21820 [Waterburya agarophytonicola K14]|uniref:Uncharacterized protein n=1 Tax=Waterburya agarophytonicola KI4 TaxID=2874699 RepID=A0A964BTW3_9CYAN|nr:DUF6208 family protein [Waterburya agarophytonicola]MCC0179598.1 hypothetical protein [Waterburya agarophytonicola KI4]
MDKIFLLWEIPLALASFVFYKVMKFIIGNLFTIYLAIDKKKASQWRVLSQKTINAPLVLPVLMTKGPRWNTHAIIGTLGPFFVNETLEIDIDTANKSARSWIAVVYSFPAYKTITSIESEKINSDSSWHTIKLPAGKYSLGVRYYNRFDTINYPAVKVDWEPYVEAYNIPNNINDYYHNLIEAKNWFYSSLHYYIFTILKLRNYLPESFVRREFLPVGAPATHFAYNYLESQQALEISIKPEILQQFDIYFTLYDRSSLPLSWCIIKEVEYSLSPQDTKGYFLLRVRPKPEFATTTVKVKSQLLSLTDSMQTWSVHS